MYKRDIRYLRLRVLSIPPVTDDDIFLCKKLFNGCDTTGKGQEKSLCKSFKAVIKFSIRAADSRSRCNHSTNLKSK